MLNKIILASKSKVRKEILDKHNIFCEVKPSYVDEDVIKRHLLVSQLRQKLSQKI
jgi:septum formation protein